MMGKATTRWIALGLLLMLALSMIGMMAYARGPEHHRGDEIGTHGTKIVVVRAPA
jgi:hypothetical protein